MFYVGVKHGLVTLSAKTTDITMFENRVLRRIFGSEWEEVRGMWRKVHNEELLNMYSPVIMRMIRSRSIEICGTCCVHGAEDKCIQGFEVFTAVAMKSTVFWDIRPCSPLKSPAQGTLPIVLGLRKCFTDALCSKVGATGKRERVRRKSTDVSEEHVAYIIRVKE
jgi:hypothetical protein